MDSNNFVKVYTVRPPEQGTKGPSTSLGPVNHHWIQIQKLINDVTTQKLAFGNHRECLIHNEKLRVTWQTWLPPEMDMADLFALTLIPYCTHHSNAIRLLQSYHPPNREVPFANRKKHTTTFNPTPLFCLTSIFTYTIEVRIVRVTEGAAHNLVWDWYSLGSSDSPYLHFISIGFSIGIKPEAW